MQGDIRRRGRPKGAGYDDSHLIEQTRTRMVSLGISRRRALIEIMDHPNASNIRRLERKMTELDKRAMTHPAQQAWRNPMTDPHFATGWQNTHTLPKSAPTRKTPPNPWKPSHFGVVLFDDTRTPSAGWTAVCGQEPKRIERMDELSTDTLWWTNMSYTSFFTDTQTWRNPHLRHEQFLVVNQSALMLEWGFDIAATPLGYTAEICATMFARVMTMAGNLARQCDPTCQAGDICSDNTLREGMRRLLPKPEYPEGEAVHTMNRQNMYNGFTRTSVRSPKGSKFLRLMRPRAAYALEMLKTPIPVGPFAYSHRSKLLKLAPDFAAWLRTTPLPVMGNISVESQKLPPVFGFSTCAGETFPSWVPQPEMIEILEFSPIKAHSAFVGSGYGNLMAALPAPILDFLDDEASHASWSAGILAETIWRAALSGEEPGQGTWRGAWMKAADKVAMSRLAQKLSDLGHAIGSYGYGWVNCMVTDDQMEKTIKDGLTLGLTPRLMDIPHDIFPEKSCIPWGGDQKSMEHTRMSMLRNKQWLWQLDEFPLCEPETRAEKLKALRAAERRKDG